MFTARMKMRAFFVSTIIYPPSCTATTDEKMRFNSPGLRSGKWVPGLLRGLI